MRARDLDDGNRLLGALGGDAQRIDLAAQHVALDEVAHEAVEHRCARVDLVMPTRADGLRLPAGWRRGPRPVVPPVLTNTVSTAQPSSARRGTQYDVSRPPEKARATTGW